MEENYREERHVDFNNYLFLSIKSMNMGSIVESILCSNIIFVFLLLHFFLLLLQHFSSASVFILFPILVTTNTVIYAVDV